MGKYLVPFQGRNKSGTVSQNFLWQEDNIFIMDNHRAALWCWFQYINKEEKYSLFHIDQHYDTGLSIIKESRNNIPDLFKISLNDYLDLGYEPEGMKGPRIKTFRWDNYLTVYLENFQQNIEEVYFATQKQGTLIKHKLTQVELFQLIGNLDYDLSYHNNWIFNLDLDIMFNIMKVDVKERFFQFLSDEFISELGKIIKKNLDEKRIKVLTIALSPECCGGWDESERILNLLTVELGINFSLPKTN